MWVYRQRTGWLCHDDALIGIGYSGYGPDKNTPISQDRVNCGPIPRGLWIISEMLPETDTHGPLVLRLTPAHETETFGRAGFLMHGDSIKSPGTASHGCIIMTRKVRERVWASGDRHLSVEE